MTEPVAWTFVAGGEPTEQLDWLTDIMAARTGPEQRNRLRTAPIVTLGFSGLEEGDDRRWLENLLHSNGAGTWWVPWRCEGQALAAPLADGSTSIPLDTGLRHFVAGGKAMLVGDSPRLFEVVDITDVAASSVTLATGTLFDWPVGTMVYPVFRGKLPQAFGIPRFTGDAGRYEVSFRADEPIDWPAGGGLATYRGLPVFEWMTDWSEDPTDVPERAMAVMGNDISLPVEFDLVGMPRNVIGASFTLITLEEIAAFRSLLYALAGAWGAIWAPGFSHDFRVAANVANGATTIDMRWSGFSDQPLTDNRRDIRIQLASGTVHYRRITAAAQISGAAERLTLDAPFATGFSAAQVARVSFLQACRQEADTNLLRWWSGDVARAQLAFRGMANHGL